MKRLWLLILLTTLFLTEKVRSQTFLFDFSAGYQGWTGDFADYPIEDSLFMELEFNRSALPSPLDTGKYALMISGNNHSDDLFMFIRRKITGLMPNKIYKLLIEIELASDAPTNAMGIGGSPGESVFLKAGASLMEPRKVQSEGYYRMNIDKSNQAMPGADMDTIGHVGVSDTTNTFTLINRTNASHLFSFSTDNEGSAWVCIGTDSGFEGTTTLFYNKISLTFDNMTGTGYNGVTDRAILYPNPASDWLVINDKTSEIRTIELFNSSGQITNSAKNSDRISVKNLPPGTYTVRIHYADNLTVTRKIIIQ
jgi:hypothetical protein